jgi:hypothetical protein
LIFKIVDCWFLLVLGPGWTASLEAQTMTIFLLYYYRSLRVSRSEFLGQGSIAMRNPCHHLAWRTGKAGCGMCQHSKTGRAVGSQGELTCSCVFPCPLFWSPSCHLQTRLRVRICGCSHTAPEMSNRPGRQPGEREVMQQAMLDGR